MNRNVVSGIVVVVVLAVCVLGWLVLPALEDARLVVDDEAAMHVERARRLLHRYSVTLTRTGLLRDQLFENDVDIDIEDPDALEREVGNHGDLGPEPRPESLRASAGQVPIDRPVDRRRHLVQEAVEEAREAEGQGRGHRLHARLPPRTDDGGLARIREMESPGCLL